MTDRDVLAALKEAVAFIVDEYPEASRAAGNWPTVDPLIKGWQAVIAQAEGSALRAIDRGEQGRR